MVHLATEGKRSRATSLPAAVHRIDGQGAIDHAGCTVPAIDARCSGHAARGLLAAAIMLTATIIATPAAATVYEIGSDGSITIHGVDEQPAAGQQVKPSILADQQPARPTPMSLRAAFDAASDAFELSVDLVEAVAWVESRFRERARSPAGAYGVMQLMPGTAIDMQVDPARPSDNIRGGTAYLRLLLDRYRGDTVKAIAAYNAGPGAVDRFGGVPPWRETRRYVDQVLARLSHLATQSKSEARP